MAKKVKKRAAKKISKKSWFEKLFTFTSVVIISAVLLSTFIVYEVINPS